MKQVFYEDGLVTLDSEGLTIHRYYFPFGTSRRIPYDRIVGIQEVPMGFWTGKGRLWGSGDLRHWFPLDLHRPQKDKALILNVGAWVKPVITPDDPNRVLALLRERIVQT